MRKKEQWQVLSWYDIQNEYAGPNLEKIIDDYLSALRGKSQSNSVFIGYRYNIKIKPNNMGITIVNKDEHND